MSLPPHCSTDLCDGFCENKGTCVKDARGTPSCRCVGSFIGTHCEDKSDFAYIAGSIAAIVVFLIVIALFIWMICARAKPQKEPKKLIAQTNDQTELPKRESWMTELPPEKAVHLGLGPRKFKKSYADNSKSSRNAWTETPADKKKVNKSYFVIQRTSFTTLLYCI
jgi:hypothetical protein